MFITFEGGEGSSKTTQSRLLSDYLTSIGVENILTREPGGTNFGERFRDLILHNEVNPMTELLAMMAVRNEHIQQVIKPSLAQGKVVICDRFVDSSACYQTQNSQISIERVYDLHKSIFANFMPDLTILLDLEPHIAFKRISARNAGALDKNESRSMQYHQKIHTTYHLLAQMFPKRIKIVRADQHIEEIQIAINKMLHQNWYF